MSTREELLRIKKRYEKELTSIKGVWGVGVNGSILLYVSKITPQARMFIPQTLEGIPVKVIETDKPRLLSFPIVNAIYMDRTTRIRPAPGGVSIGAPDISAGTFTSTFLKKGKVSGLSNNHILSGEWGTHPASDVGTSILQPGIFDGGKLEDPLGALAEWIPVKLDRANLVDAALFDSELLSKEIIEVGEPGQTIEPKVGMIIKKSGARSGLTYSKIIDVDATLKVEGWGEAVFTDQIVTKPAFGIPGDSGSWTGSENDETLGLLFAGSPQITILNKAVNVEKLLGGDIIPPLPYLSPLTLSTLIPMFAVGSVLSTRGKTI